MIFTNIVLITLALLCTFACYYIWKLYYRIRHRFFVREEIKLPGPKKLLKNFLRGTSDELLDLINILTKNYPSPFQIQMYYTQFVIIYEPNQIKTVLQHCLEKSIFYKFMNAILGVGLLTAPASIWTQNRKIIAPCFNLTMWKEFFDTFVEQSFILANKLEMVKQNGNEIILLDHIESCVLDIANGSMIGIKILDSNIKDRYFKAVIRLKEILRYRMYFSWTFKNYLFFDVIFNFTALGREQRKILKLLNSLVKSSLQQLCESDKLYATRKTIFASLIETFCKKNFSEKSINDNMLTLIIMVTNKISITLDFTVFMLANFPEIQEKVYKELKDLYGMETPISTPVKYDDLQYMPYLDRVIKETMRLFPAFPIIDRVLPEDIKIGEFFCPKNSNILISLIRMYRNKEYWENPLKFDPDRFLPERMKSYPLNYYIPFGDGPRNCIGIKYAMISMKVILVTLVRTFVFKVDKRIAIDEIKLQTDMILSPIKPLKVRIEKRNLQ